MLTENGGLKLGIDWSTLLVNTESMAENAAFAILHLFLQRNIDKLLKHFFE